MLSRSWLRLPPLRALSETWLSSVFIGSCPGLTSSGGVEEGATTAAGGLVYQTPLVIDLEKCMSFTWGGECGTKAPLKMLAEFD